jgi:hypothetical protein
MGPGIAPSGTTPDILEAPADAGVMVVEGAPSQTPEYERFTPQVVNEVARFDLSVRQDDDSYVAVLPRGIRRGGREVQPRAGMCGGVQG